MQKHREYTCKKPTQASKYVKIIKNGWNNEKNIKNKQSTVLTFV